MFAVVSIVVKIFISSSLPVSPARVIAAFSLSLRLVDSTNGKEITANECNAETIAALWLYRFSASLYGCRGEEFNLVGP
jgi:hypothetical protein